MKPKQDWQQKVKKKRATLPESSKYKKSKGDWSIETMEKEMTIHVNGLWSTKNQLFWSLASEELQNAATSIQNEFLQSYA